MKYYHNNIIYLENNSLFLCVGEFELNPNDIWIKKLTEKIFRSKNKQLYFH